MTIEGRPYIGPDDTYEKQRKDRMGDAIGDYLTDEKVSSRQAYEEILSEVQGWIDYHRKNLTKAEHLREYLMGSRPVDLDDMPTYGTQTLYEDILNYKA